MSLSSFQLCRQMKMVSNTSQSNRSSRWTLKYFTRFLNVCKTLPRSPLKSEEDFKSNFHDRTTLDATHHLKMEVSHTRCLLLKISYNRFLENCALHEMGIIWQELCLGWFWIVWVKEFGEHCALDDIEINTRLSLCLG